MKTAIIYRSLTGHSRRIARAIAAELHIPALDVKTNPKLENLDLLFIVGGIYSSQSLPKLIQFAENLTPQNARQVALITTSATNKVGQDQIRTILQKNGISILDEYRGTGNFLFMKLGHPNRQEIQNAVSFAKKLALKSHIA